MAEPIPKRMRKYSSPYLSDHLGQKIIVKCDICGKRRQYDAQAVLDRLDEDMTMPDLVRHIAKADGCAKAINRQFEQPCGLHYDLEAMAQTQKGAPAAR
jgi:hypothetical protein